METKLESYYKSDAGVTLAENISPFYTMQCILRCKYYTDIFFIEPKARHLILDTFLVELATQELELKHPAEMQ